MESLTKITKLILFILAAFGLLHFGASFLIPFLFGIFLATIIPYFGPLISGLVPILFSFIFFDSIPKS